MHMDEMRRPLRQIIQNMRGVHNRTRPTRRLPLEELEKIPPAQQIEVHGDLVEQQHRPRPQQAHGQLDAAALAVRHCVHAPAQVDVEDGDEFGLARGVVPAADRVEQRGHVDVGAHDRVEHPFQAEVGDALEAFLEGVDAGDRDGTGGGEAFAGEEAEERGFAGAVG